MRDEWRDAILNGLSAEDATQRMLESFDEYLEEAPIVAPLAWEGRRVPKRDRIARLPFVPDPVSPNKPLLILVSTFSKKDVFGPDLGEVVAQGVDCGLTAEADDVGQHMGWRVVAASAQEAWLMARYRAEEDN